MGSCWSEPPIAQAQRQTPIYTEKIAPTAPPMNQYTYAVKPGQQMVYPQQQYVAYPYQQYQQQYFQQQYPQQQYPPQQYPPQQQMGAGTAFVGGLILGAVVEDILDPIE
jgi:hypothetical protein